MIALFINIFCGSTLGTIEYPSKGFKFITLRFNNIGIIDENDRLFREQNCGNSREKYIAFLFCICYNAHRQREIISPCKMANENPGAATSGVFYSYLWQWEGLTP